jgi:hypothetical protein
MDKEIVARLHGSFEAMVHKEGQTGVEYWLARDLQELLGYTQWRNFEAVIDKAITACQNSGYEPKNHFAHARKMLVGLEILDAVRRFGGRDTLRQVVFEGIGPSVRA